MIKMRQINIWRQAPQPNNRLVLVIMKVHNGNEKQCKMINRENLYTANHINFQLLCKELAYETPLNLSLLKDLIQQFKHIIDAEPNLLMIEDPALVIGDIHGQFYDLLKILAHANVFRSDRLLKTKLVFLGDYVDRGINAVEVMILLICLKIEYPENIFLLRGNHESRIMTAQYNFKSECCIKYSQDIYNLMMDAFDLLPLACVINKAYFCVHGGISDKLMDIKQINNLNRKQEIPVIESAYCDFIWSDPVQNQQGLLPSKSIFNGSRDCSIVFGAELVRQFLNANELSTIIRGHQVFIEGFKTYDWSDIKPTASVITIFSAPNYCGTCGNKAAILKIENNTFKIKQFKEQQPQKYKFLVKFDVFTWTLPEIMSNTKQILLEIMESIISTSVPQLKQESQERKLDIFVNYAIKQKLLKPIAKRQQEKKLKEFLTPEEERSYLFNRSHDYYAQFQKLPKNH